MRKEEEDEGGGEGLGWAASGWMREESRRLSPAAMLHIYRLLLVTRAPGPNPWRAEPHYQLNPVVSDNRTARP